MRLLSVFITLFIFSCGSHVVEKSPPVFEKFAITDDEGTLPYRVLLPEKYNARKAYPLILVLHGAGERGSDNTAQLTHGANLFLNEEIRKKHKAIVVFPQCPEESYWSNVKKERTDMSFSFTFSADGAPTAAMKSLQNLIPELHKSYKIDKKRMYVGGLSMGGMGTMELVRRNPNTFAAAFAICGGAHPETAPVMTKTKWWVFHGDADVVVDYQHSVNMVNALKLAGADVKFTTYEGVNHNSWENAFAEPELLPWLMSKSLE